MLTSSTVLAEHLVATESPGASVLAIGGDGLLDAVRSAGLQLVQGADRLSDVVAVGWTSRWTRATS